MWDAVGELGWAGVSVPERLGGSGMGLLEETIVAEETAAALLPAPLFTTIAFALPILLHAPDESGAVAEIATGKMPATLAWADQGGSAALHDAIHAKGAVAQKTPKGWFLSGSKWWVLDADRVKLILVLASTRYGQAVFAVDRAAAEVSRLDTIDRTRPLAKVKLLDAPARLVLTADVTPAVLERVRLRAATLAAAEAVGIAQRVLDISVEYVSMRKQFGRLVGAYQGVSHQLADTYVDLELARSLVIWAALAVDADSRDARAAVAAAASALPRAVTACERAIQVHGGVGTTWESILHRYYKRAIALTTLDGPAWRQRSQVWSELAGKRK